MGGGVSLHDPDTMDVFLSHIRAGLTRAEACKAMKIAVNPTMKLIREDPVIYEQVREAEDEKFAPVLKTLFEAAQGTDAFGEPNIDAIKAVLDYKKHLDVLDAKKEEARQRAAASTPPPPPPMPALIMGEAALQALTEGIERRRAIEAGEIIDVESQEG